jgi:flagella basal body P-ring formation protein FlgA
MRLLATLLIPISLLAGEPCVVVEGDRFTAGELAKAVPAFSLAPAESLLGYSPAPGVQRTLRQTELELFARGLGLQLDVPKASVCIVRYSTVLAAEELQRAIAASLQGTNARFELIDFSKTPIPKGRLEFPRTGLTRPRAGEPAVWKGRVVYSGSKSVSIWAKVRVSASVVTVVAAGDLPAGKLIEASDLRLQSAETNPFEQPGLSKVEEAVGLTLRRSLRAGDPVVASTLAKPNDVARGDRVEVNAQSGGASLKFMAVAETSGSKGSRVLLKNPENGKRFAALVECKGRVVVLANGEDSAK